MKRKTKSIFGLIAMDADAYWHHRQLIQLHDNSKIYNKRNNSNNNKKTQCTYTVLTTTTTSAAGFAQPSVNNDFHFRQIDKRQSCCRLLKANDNCNKKQNRFRLYRAQGEIWLEVEPWVLNANGIEWKGKISVRKQSSTNDKKNSLIRFKSNKIEINTRQ